MGNGHVPQCLWYKQGEIYRWDSRPSSQGSLVGVSDSQVVFLVPELGLSSSFLLYSSFFFNALFLSVSVLSNFSLSFLIPFFFFPLSLTLTLFQALFLNSCCLFSGFFLIASSLWLRQRKTQSTLLLMLGLARLQEFFFFFLKTEIVSHIHLK